MYSPLFSDLVECGANKCSYHGTFDYAKHYGHEEGRNRRPRGPRAQPFVPPPSASRGPRGPNRRY